LQFSICNLEYGIQHVPPCDFLRVLSVSAANPFFVPAPRNRKGRTTALSRTSRRRRRSRDASSVIRLGTPLEKSVFPTLYAEIDKLAVISLLEQEI
jgi:hypothetical protein